MNIQILCVNVHVLYSQFVHSATLYTVLSYHILQSTRIDSSTTPIPHTVSTSALKRDMKVQLMWHTWIVTIS